MSQACQRIALCRREEVETGRVIRIEKGAKEFGEWPTFKQAGGNSPREPRAAVEFLTQFFRYAANLRRRYAAPAKPKVARPKMVSVAGSGTAVGAAKP